MFKEQALPILEAAAPHMLADMRAMTLVEIARRDRPKAMEAARQKLMQERRASQYEMVRSAKAEAWAAAWREAAVAHPPLADLGTPNPYDETFADRMARRSLEAVDSDSWRAKQ
jgi:hypothetical protein